MLRKRYGRAPFDGEGAYRYGGRWSSPGIRLSSASEHQSLALLLAHLPLVAGQISIPGQSFEHTHTYLQTLNLQSLLHGLSKS